MSGGNKSLPGSVKKVMQLILLLLKTGEKRQQKNQLHSHLISTSAPKFSQTNV
jgi:hypothetical protein